MLKVGMGEEMRGRGGGGSGIFKNGRVTQNGGVVFEMEGGLFSVGFEYIFLFYVFSISIF